jgi:hypothetical protein
MLYNFKNINKSLLIKYFISPMCLLLARVQAGIIIFFDTLVLCFTEASTDHVEKHRGP